MLEASRRDREREGLLLPLKSKLLLPLILMWFCGEVMQKRWGLRWPALFAVCRRSIDQVSKMRKSIAIDITKMKAATLSNVIAKATGSLKRSSRGARREQQQQERKIIRKNHVINISSSLSVHLFMCPSIIIIIIIFGYNTLVTTVLRVVLRARLW